MNVTVNEISAASNVAEELHKKKLQISFRTVNAHQRLFEYAFEETKGIAFSKYSIVVPKTGYLRVLPKFYCVLSWLSWLVLPAIIILSILIFMCVQRIHRWIVDYHCHQVTSELSFKQITFTYVESFFGGRLLDMPNTWSVRYILIGWIVYGFCLTIAFKSELISFLVRPTLLPDIDKFVDLYLSDLKVYVHNFTEIDLGLNARDLYEWKRMFRRIKKYNSTDSLRDFHLLLAKRQPEYAYVLPEFYARYVAHRYTDKYGKRPFFHIMKDHLHHLQQSYLIEKGSPYLDRINDLIGRLHSYGFVKYWREELYHQIASYENDMHDKFADPDVELVLKIEHLFWFFGIWLFGMLIGCFLFLCEIGFY